jgi:hypothetical protein
LLLESLTPNPETAVIIELRSQLGVIEAIDAGVGPVN